MHRCSRSTGDRAARLEVLADTAEALASALGPGGEFVGLIAYQDQQVDENIYFQEFEDLVKSRENILLSDWSYSRLLLQECVIRERIEMPFNLVVTCSYHIAYAALTAGIPVIFILDLPYYRQKCDGLLHHFDADRLLLIGLGGKKGREITEFLRDTKEAMYNPSVAKQWFSLTQVRSKIGKAVSEIEAARKAQTFEDILTNYRESALALGELRRRVILMERYEANLQAEIAALRDRSFLIAPKKEVRKLKQEWRRIREQLGLRKRKATTQ